MKTKDILLRAFIASTLLLLFTFICSRFVPKKLPVPEKLPKWSIVSDDRNNYGFVDWNQVVCGDFSSSNEAYAEMLKTREWSDKYDERHGTVRSWKVIKP